MEVRAYLRMSTCHDASHLSATEGNDEISTQTAFQPRISGSKNASAPEAEGDTNARRSHWAHGRLLATGVLLGRSLEPDRKSFPDARSPLRIPGLSRTTGPLSEDFVNKPNTSQPRQTCVYSLTSD